MEQLIQRGKKLTLYLMPYDEQGLESVTWVISADGKEPKQSTNETYFRNGTAFIELTPNETDGDSIGIVATDDRGLHFAFPCTTYLKPELPFN